MLSGRHSYEYECPGTRKPLCSITCEEAWLKTGMSRYFIFHAIICNFNLADFISITNKARHQTKQKQPWQQANVQIGGDKICLFCFGGKTLLLATSVSKFGRIMRETKTPTRPNTTMTGALFAVLRREDWIVNSQCVTLIICCDTKVGCTISLRHESYSYGFSGFDDIINTSFKK